MDNFLRQTSAEPADPAGSSDTPVAPQLDGYRTGRLLGAGGSAAVWLVENERSGDAHALKVPNAPSAGGVELAQLRREVTVLHTLDHPHLLTVHDVVPTDLGPALLMEYAAGGSLLNLVTVRRRLTVGECVTVLVPVAQALAFLHSRSVVHGDVAPGNVLITPEGKPLLSDLGTGRLLAEAGPAARFTDGFAAEGLVRGEGPRQPDDVYAVAALGWYVLTGRPPEEARRRAPLTVLVQEVPAELRDILEAGLAEDPELRPSADEFAREVLSSAEAQPLDLVSAVHPAVLPHLLTRRAVRNQDVDKRPRRSWLARPAAFARAAAARPAAALRRRPEAAKPGAALPAHRRRASRSEPARRLVRPVIAVVLVLAGVFLALPHLFDSSHRPPAPAARDTVALQVTSGQAGATETAAGSAQEGGISEAVKGRLASDDPLEALPALAAVRARSFATADPSLLAHVNVDGSDAMAADREILDDLQDQGRVFQGLSVRLEKMELLEPDNVAETAEDRAAVRATARMSGYVEADSSGKALQRVPEPEPQDLLFVLERADGAWKIGQVHTPDGV